MDLGLKGKSVIVTGSGRGIGRVTALTFAQEGANIVIADIVFETAVKTSQEIAALGVGSLAVKADIGNRESVDAMIKATVDRFGRLDILVNNATIKAPASVFAQARLEDIKNEVDIIYMGTANCIQSALKTMLAQKSGAIISLLTDSARVGDVMMGNYAACKAAIGALSRTLAREVGDSGIRVNCVSPSMTQTDLWRKTREEERLKVGEEKYQYLQKQRLKLYPLGRFGDPQDIANAIVFLASDRASWITGQTLSVNGGYAIGPW